MRAYQVAFAIALGIPVIAAAAGWIPFALVAAALAVPIVFTVYLYDVNEWDDQPVPVVLAAIVVTSTSLSSNNSSATIPGLGGAA